MKKNFEQVSITEATASTAEEKIKADEASTDNGVSFMKSNSFALSVDQDNLEN